MVSIAITAGSSGIGLEACRQLAAVDEVTKIIITARSREKAEQAIAFLVSATGKERDLFDFVVLDVLSIKSVTAAVEAFPEVDRLCLNAGGLAKSIMHVSGTTETVALNTLGHTALVDGLLAAKKVKTGGRIVYIGSEVSRSVLAFTGLLPNYCGRFAAKDIDKAISQNYKGCYGCFPLRGQLGDYKNAKILGHMHFANLAKERPDLYIICTSPGGVGGQFMTKAKSPMRQIGRIMPCALWAACATHSPNVQRAVEIGAERYVQVLTGDPQFVTGSMPMSPKQCCGLCFWGARGPMVDNRPMVGYFKYVKGNEDLHANASGVIRDYVDKWSTGAGPEDAFMQ